MLMPPPPHIFLLSHLFSWCMFSWSFENIIYWFYLFSHVNVYIYSILV